ncbi:phage GP46 family protein [Lonsdalea quercina]|uniref:phage GP46 family protein n=2 Tax=Lonsdalea quercina TaxID=71657 RepID=UPI00047D4019|nr:phage GP46 family protein [Lonsdalea quercina]
MILTMNGVSRTVSFPTDPLTRAVIISIATWRRAGSDDDVDQVMGWWGDCYPSVQNDRIGSRLYQLRREKITNKTPGRVRDMLRESLQWMVDDGVAARVEVAAERTGISTIQATITISKSDGTTVSIAFNDLWSELDG